jgi:catechol 2,3-dioxygenase-like lactoylglutathione lyase family enzyme
VTPLQPIAGRPPDQIGILVHHLEDALPRYERQWGLSEWRGFVYGPDTIPRMTFRGEPGRYRVRIAITRTTPQIELLDVLEGPSIYDGWLDRHGEGLHHLGFWVESLEKSVAAMEAGGLVPIQTGSGYGLDGDGGYAYFDTTETLGVLVELIEVPKRRRPPDFTWPADL